MALRVVIIFRMTATIMTLGFLLIAAMTALLVAWQPEKFQ
jgi:hypothetical protein